ncbi:hypothetical protein D3C78_927930 [compost metagenome]
MENKIDTLRLRNTSSIETILAEKGLVIDAATRRPIRLTHVALFGHEGEWETVVGLIDGVATNLCAIEFMNNQLVLSRNAVGNKLNGENMPMADRVETYRDWEHHKVWDVLNVAH